MQAKQPAERVLLLWGGAGADGLVLEPAFVVRAPPALPTQGGPYRLQGYDGQGRRLFSLSFTPLEASRGGAHFAFAVPLEPGSLAALEAITLSGPPGSLRMDRATRRAPVAMVTDDATGRIRAMLRSGDVAANLRVGTTVTLSRGLPPVGGLERRE